MANKPVRPVGSMHIHLAVSDMKTSIDFYTTVLGFFYDHGISEIAWLTRCNLMLTLGQGEPPKDPQLYFGWAVESMAELEELYEHFYRKRQRLSAAPSTEEARYYFFIYDPDGYPIVISFEQMEHPWGRGVCSCGAVEPEAGDDQNSSVSKP
ncbi:VOC family protein [bacterium]|nr:VOC family protein [bacterium]